MAGSFFNALYGTNSPGLALIAFSFQTNAGNAIDQSTIKGNKVASVTRSNTGVITVTLDDNSYDVLYAKAEVEDIASPTFASGIQPTIRFGATGGRAADPLSFTINTFGAPVADTGTGVITKAAADLAAGRVISVLLVVQKSIGA